MSPNFWSKNLAPFIKSSLRLNIHMAATTTLTINDLEVQFSLSGLSDVVIRVGSTLSGNDAGTTDHLNRRFIVATPTLSSFIPFDDLTESDVANFVKATDSYTTALQILTATIEKQKQAPTTGMEPLPWA